MSLKPRGISVGWRHGVLPVSAGHPTSTHLLTSRQESRTSCFNVLFSDNYGIEIPLCTC